MGIGIYVYTWKGGECVFGVTIYCVCLYRAKCIHINVCMGVFEQHANTYTFYLQILESAASSISRRFSQYSHCKNNIQTFINIIILSPMTPTVVGL